MIKKLITHPYVALLGRIVLGAIFIYASFHKILHPAAFAKAVVSYQLLPLSFVNLFAIMLPWLEFISGMCLLLGLCARGGIVIITLLITMFFFAMGSALARGIDISCGCFPSWMVQKITIRSLIRDSVFLFIALQVLFYNRDLWSLDNLIKKRGKA